MLNWSEYIVSHKRSVTQQIMMQWMNLWQLHDMSLSMSSRMWSSQPVMTTTILSLRTSCIRWVQSRSDVFVKVLSHREAVFEGWTEGPDEPLLSHHCFIYNNILSLSAGTFSHRQGYDLLILAFTPYTHTRTRVLISLSGPPKYISLTWW